MESDNSPADVGGGEDDRSPMNFLLSSLSDLNLYLVMLYALLIYVMGHFGFSVFWIIMILPIWIYQLKRQRETQLKRSFAEEFDADEKKTLTKILPELPSWVFFPDIEKATWLNEIIKRLWPCVGDYVQDYVKKLEPMLRQKISKLTSIDSFKFVKTELGDVPFKIYGVKVHSQTYSRREIIMDMDIAYSGDCSFQVAVSKVKAGIKDIKFRGTMRVVMKPLVKEIPLVGGLQVFFLRAPVLDFNLTETANVFDIPGIKDMLVKAIIDILSGMVVLPNKFPIKLISSIPEILFSYPEPKGVLRVNVIEAENLMKKDIGFSAKSDPYAIISVGATEFRTATIDKNINPQWNFICEALVDDIHGQSVDLEVRDEDMNNKDDLLGSLSLDISHIAKQGTFEKWISLERAETGSVHLQITWFSLCSDLLKLQQYSGAPLQSKSLSTCVLIVYIESAESLPNAELKSMEEPSPYASVMVDNIKHTTKVCQETNDPQWNNGFCILISDPDHQKLSVEVFDQKTGRLIGHLQYAIGLLKYETNLKTHRAFVLKNSGSDSHITMSLQLKIMTQDTPETASGSQPATPLASSPPNVTLGPSHSLELKSKDDQLSDTVEIIVKPLEKKEVPENLPRKRHVESHGSSEDGSCAIQMTLRYSLQRQLLIIVVHKVQNVPVHNQSDLPDTFVKLLLLPGTSKENKRKTSTIKNHCNPVFDETLEYPLIPSELNNRTLIVTVCCRSTSGIFGRTVVIGKKTVELADLDLSNSVTKWFAIDINHEDSGGNE